MRIQEIKANLVGGEVLLLTRLITDDVSGVLKVEIIITDDIAAVAGAGTTIQLIPIEGYGQFRLDAPSGKITILNSIEASKRINEEVFTDSEVIFEDDSFWITQQGLTIRDFPYDAHVGKSFYIEYIPNESNNTRGTLKLFVP
jgi:hypothetical protein